MNLYEFEGKKILQKYGIPVPKGEVILRNDVSVVETHPDLIGIASLQSQDSVVKAQILAGKRGKNNGIRFCSSSSEVKTAVNDLFSQNIREQYVASVLVEEKLDIAEEHYLSITYDTNRKQPVLIYSPKGGMDIEDVSEEFIVKKLLDVRQTQLDFSDVPFAQELWTCFLQEDCRVAEINPLVKTTDGHFVAADAKIALDDDAFFRHPDWAEFGSRSQLGRLPTEREIQVQEIDKGEEYYRGTAGKYIEMDGDIAILFSGGGASIANMDALMATGLRPANYTEYSGNPPREKVRALAKIVLSKPGLRGLWIAGGVANFTNIAETLGGIVDALDEIKPHYPIVVRRAGPHEDEGMALMQDCATRNGLQMTLLGKEVSMSASAQYLADIVMKS